MNIPNFLRRRQKLEPVTFVPVHKVFEPQIEIRALKDISGWVNKDKTLGKKFELRDGHTYYVDATVAREWQAKGYVQILRGTVTPVSDDERAEMLSTVTTIGPGAASG